MGRFTRLRPALALIGLGAVVTATHLAIAALAVCLNETPALALGLRQAVPVIPSLASGVLTFLGLSDARSSTCDPAAPAGAMALAGVAYLAGVLMLERGGISAPIQWTVIGLSAVAIQTALFFMPGLLSSDILDYASHGRVAAIHGANPYLKTPADFPSDPFAQLGAWPSVVTVYGPLWTRIDAAVTGLLANQSAIQVSFAYKLLALVSGVLSAVLIYSIVRRWNCLGATSLHPAAAVGMWLWNPLVNVEIAGNAHNEGLMMVFVLLGFLILTSAARSRSGVLTVWLWPAALLCFWIGALIKFVPAAVGAIVSLVWLRRAQSDVRRLERALVVVAAICIVTVIVAWPWLDSPAVAGPLLGLAAGGQRFKDAWQDAPAAWLTVRVVPKLGVPDDPATLRMDVARSIVWGVTRTLFLAYVVFEGLLLWKAKTSDPGKLLRTVASASVRALLIAILLYVSQVYAWYFLWPMPIACLLGLREPWSRAAIVFGLTFLPAYYLREFQPYGVFYLPIYALLGLGILWLTWVGARLPRLVPQY